MILTREDYEKAYKILDNEWEDEVKPALEEIHTTLESMKDILLPYKTTATLCSISTDPYQFFHHCADNLRDVIKYAGNPKSFFPFVEGARMWTCVLALAPSLRDSRVDMSDVHKGLLYWRKKVNEIKDGIRLFYESGAKYLENYVTNLINDRLAPKANEQADEFLSAFGMTKKIQKVKITISLTNVN
jgi:hypothetical protein